MHSVSNLHWNLYFGDANSVVLFSAFVVRVPASGSLSAKSADENEDESSVADRWLD